MNNNKIYNINSKIKIYLYFTFSINILSQNFKSYKSEIRLCTKYINEKKVLDIGK